MSSLNGISSSRCSLTSHDRKLRYRALLEDLSTLDDGDDNKERMEKTENAVRQVQSLLAEGGVEERVKHPGEGYLDSRVLRATSDLAVRCSEAVSGNANLYDRHELAQHIRDNPEAWAFGFPREAPPLAYLYGTFAPAPVPPRARAPRARLQRQPESELVAPENVDKLEKTEQGPEMVSRVHRFVSKACRGGPLSYFHAALDPTSFSRTIENIYHLSFLVRDGLLAVYLDEESGLPFIKPVPAAERTDGSHENQFIVSIDMQRWKDLIEAFDITKPMMVLKRQ